MCGCINNFALYIIIYKCEHDIRFKTSISLMNGTGQNSCHIIRITSCYHLSETTNHTS